MLTLRTPLHGMHLGDILVARGLITLADLTAAHERQQRTGLHLGDVLADMAVMSRIEFDAAMAWAAAHAPALPRSIEETGIPNTELLNLMLRLMSLEACETATDLSHAMRLPYGVVQKLLEQARDKKWLQPAGLGLSIHNNEPRYALSQEGHSAAADALHHCTYLGPAPVNLDSFCQQVTRQAINKEKLDVRVLLAGLSGLSMRDELVRRLLPAINAGRTMLLYGPPGNGKTSIAERIAGLFSQIIFVPHAVNISGHIMRVYDPNVHKPVLTEADRLHVGDEGLSATLFDDRFVLCRRPFAMAGGELTLEMLDLQYDAETKFYDAPMHIKALNGVFLVDDFGRQRIGPKELLNRWIVPMESRVEYLKLHTGKSFGLPFDELLIFSTNLDPKDIMDPALLRRLPYKIKLASPSAEEFRALFLHHAQASHLSGAEDVIDYAIELLTVRTEFGLANFQPKFICEQVAEVCASFYLQRHLTRDLVRDSLANLYVEIADIM